MSNPAARKGGLIAAIRTWIAFACLVTASIDVLDLFAFSYDFRLTPFLLLSALYIATVTIEALIDAMYASPGLPLDCFGAAELVAAAFICIIACSFLFLSNDGLQVAPARLIYGIWLIVFAILFVNKEREFFQRTIVRATRAFILLDIIAVTVQIIAAISDFELPKYLGGLSIIKAGDIFRPGGLISDPNRASVMVVLLLGFAYISGDELPKEKRLAGFYYIAGLILACITISRTGTVAIGLLLLIMFLRTENKRKVVFRFCFAALVLLSAGAAYLVATSSTRELTEAASQAFLERDWSNYEHYGVMLAGAQTFLEDPKVFIIGAGWGTEYEYTKEFFPGDKYGNFHCTYLSIAVQGGVLALFCLLFLLLRPLLLRMEYGSLAIVFLWSGIFYQYHGDPLWWILLFTLNKGRLRVLRFGELQPSVAKQRSHA